MAESGRPEDDEWEVVDELLIHVDLAGNIDSGSAHHANAKFVGLDTDNPIVQIGNQVKPRG
jgi:hypothetical protein